jgi:D-aminoacyl-tRNA deacylase
LRAVIQRVSQSHVRVDNCIVGQIGRGLLVLLGVAQGDCQSDLEYLVQKVSGLRIFEDQQGKMNLSIQDIAGAVLVVSQFTLLGDVRRGRRPSFTDAAAPILANQLYLQFCQMLREQGIEVQQGIFQADMQVSLVNDGPVTIIVDSRKAF